MNSLVSGQDPHQVAEAVARRRMDAALEPQPVLPLAEDPAEGEAEQLELVDLGLPETTKLVALRRQREGGKGGRPPGARNKRAEDVARAIVERLGDPLVMLASLAVTPVDELKAAGLSIEQAIAEKRLAAIAVLPFIHQRKPLAVDLTKRTFVHLSISVGDEPQPGGVTVDLADATENRPDGIR